MSNFIVLYDSCVLYSAPLRDLLMRLALTDLYKAKWTSDIHREWMQNLLKNRPDISAEVLQQTKLKMDMHVRDSLVSNYEELVDNLTLPDPNDRHVLAAAIKANAQSILTYNLSDFPAEIVSKYGIEAQHPDDFLRHLFDLAPARFMYTIQETRLSLKNPPKSVDEYLIVLERQSLPQTVACLREYFWLI